jgi:hypothetical protein
MDTVRSIQHLHAAFILTWCVHVAYVLYLVRGFMQLKREAEELRKR